MDYKKNLKICTCLKKRNKKNDKKRKQMGLVRSEYFCECV